MVSCSREELSSSMGPQLEITLSCVSDRDTKAGEEDETGKAEKSRATSCACPWIRRSLTT